MRRVVLNLKSSKAVFRIEMSILLLLLTLVIFFLIYSYVDKVHFLKHEREVLLNKQKAQDLCFLFSQTPGVPENWHEQVSGGKSVGFLNQSSGYLSLEKLNWVADASYSSFRDNFTESFFNVRVVGLDSGDVLLNKSVDDSFVRSVVSAVCFAVYNEKVYKVVVEVWS